MTPAFLFSKFPYLAAIVLVAGVLVRYFMARRNPEAAAGQSREALEALAGGMAWRMSLGALLLLHLAGLVSPRDILLWNSSSVRLYLLEGITFVAGAVALGSWVAIMKRNLRRGGGPVATEIGDMIFLALLFTAVFSGLTFSVAERWASTWGAMTLTPYVMSLLRGKQATSLVHGMPFMVRLHVFSTFAALAILPGTRLGPLLGLGLHRGFSLLGRPFTAAGRSAEAWLQKHNPAGRIWPEED
jgi:nitrate reductase gamma subunit